MGGASGEVDDVTRLVRGGFMIPPVHLIVDRSLINAEQEIRAASPSLCQRLLHPRHVL